MYAVRFSRRAIRSETALFMQILFSGCARFFVKTGFCFCSCGIGIVFSWVAVFRFVFCAVVFSLGIAQILFDPALGFPKPFLLPGDSFRRSVGPAGGAALTRSAPTEIGGGDAFMAIRFNGDICLFRIQQKNRRCNYLLHHRCEKIDRFRS